MKICKKCGSTDKYKDRHCRPCKIAANKKSRPATKSARSAYMKTYNAQNRDGIRDAKLKRKYGISLSEYQIILERQGNKCYICWATDRPFNIDHDHKTGKVRGVLCAPCNKAIGLLQDNPCFLSRAAAYVELS